MFHTVGSVARKWIGKSKMKLRTIKDVKEYIDNIALIQGENASADMVINILVNKMCLQDNNFFYKHTCEMNKHFMHYSNLLRNAAKISYERATWIKSYLDGEMYTDQGATTKYDEIQSKNAEDIIDTTGALLWRDNDF